MTTTRPFQLVVVLYATYDSPITSILMAAATGLTNKLVDIPMAYGTEVNTVKSKIMINSTNDKRH